MTEQETAPPAAEEDVHLPVMLLDREIYVTAPTPEQILVWQRTIHRLRNAPPDTSWTGSEVMVALERLRTIIDSMMVNRADVEWLDDRFLDKTMDFAGLAPFIEKVIVAFQEYVDDQIQENGTRAERRAAKKAPAKKASRKKPTT